MPSSRAMRATAPESQGASSRPPASRSPSIEAFISGGRPSTKARVLATKSSGSATPRFLPTSQVSRIVASSSPRMSGSERPPPVGLRVTDDGTQLRGGALGVPELHREHHDVDRAGVGGLLDGLHFQLRVPERALQREAIALQRLQMPPAGDERDRVPRLLQARAEVAAHAARS